MTTINISLTQPATPYDPYWRRCITAGRAAEGLREDWRQQLLEVQREIGFEYIRFHGPFHDDMMIYRIEHGPEVHGREEHGPEEQGQPVYNFQYFDNLFDFLLGAGLRPILELSFMPSDLASGTGTVFWWKGNCTPPRDYERWAELVSRTVRHAIHRYGLEEVLSWYFEVWNEPNLTNGFWFADQAEYFKLYETTVKAIKAIHPELRVGGPASSDSGGVKAPWVDDFIAFCHARQLPLDFISTHPYPNSWPLDGYGNHKMCYRGPDSTLVDLQKIRATVDASPFPRAEIHLTEWNSSPSPRDLVHDTCFMAPFVVQNCVWGLGLVDSLGFWTFSDVFEEGRAGDTIFHGGFGLINTQGLKKASYYGYWFLNRLGEELVETGADYVVTRRGETTQVLMWNYVHYNAAFANGDRSMLTEHERDRIFQPAQAKAFQVSIGGLDGTYKVSRYTFDPQHGSVFDAWLAMGAPAEPTAEEIEYLQRKAGPELQVSRVAGQAEFAAEVTVQPHGLTLIEIQKLV